MRRAHFLTSRVGALIVAAILAPGGLTTAQQPPAPFEPPVPLRTPRLLLPADYVGSDAEPEATVRLGIDARGRVERVEVVSIRPGTDEDPVLRRTLEETLLDWRYAPQRRDGVAEPTTLEWKVRFPRRSPSGSSTPEAPDIESPEAARTAVGRAGARADAEALRSRILALPESVRLERLEREASVALAALDPATANRHASERFIVHTDVTDPKTAPALAHNLEAIFSILARELLPGIELQRERYKMHVVAYRTREGYQQAKGRLPAYEWSAGFYSPSGLIALTLDRATADDIVGTLLHEATHAFLDRHVVRRGVALPRWLGEGFADYVGNSTIKKGQLVPGKTTRRKFEAGRFAVRLGTTGGGLQVEEAKKALRAGEGLGVEELLDASLETFYGDDHSLFYASAWLLVHFLHHGAEDWGSQRFSEALLYVAEGYDPRAVFSALYGPIPELDRSFRDYVRRF